MTNRSRSADSRNESGSRCFPAKIASYSCKVRFMVVICFLLLASVVALIYFLLGKTISQQENIVALPKRLDWFSQCPSTLMDPKERFDCYPEEHRVTRQACESRGCCYLGPLDDDYNDSFVEGGEPTCVYPSNYGYEAAGKASETVDGFEVPLRRIPAPSRYGDDLQMVFVKVELQTRYRLRIKFYDPENSRYEVPVPKILMHPSTRAPPDMEREILLYSVAYNTFISPFALKVRRSNTDTILFDTSAGALTLSNQFLELTTRLPSTKLFGLGQHLKKSDGFDWETLQLFSSLTKDGNFASSVHPFYLCVEDDGNAHGVLLLNSNDMEVQLHPSPALTYRTIGGILDFYLFLGPTPEEVIQQYTEAVGRPMIPPYWSLGFHLGFQEYQSVDQIEKVIDALQTKYVPMESLIVNQDVIRKYMSGSKEFWNFSNVTTKLGNRSQKLQIHFRPSILKSALLKREEIYNVGPLNEVFVTDKWELHPIVGKNVNEDALFPNFGSSPGFTWWSDVVTKISTTVGFHGFWLAHNEPRNDVNGSVTGCLRDNLNNPPYRPKSSTKTLYDRTLCMDSLLHWREDVATFYDSHNLYGHSMILATEQAFGYSDSKKRKLILSDSTFVGSGQYSGHWIKGLENSWDGLRSAVSTVIERGMYGLALSGTNAWESKTNTWNSTTQELCLRWLQLGAFLPYMQLYGESAEHLYNSALTSSEFVHAARHAVSRRYELLPYLYTLFYLAHTNGSTVIRPLFHEFPEDNNTYSIESQFLWGSSLLISPILEQGAKKLTFYLPQGTWYDFYQGSSIQSSGEWFQETGGPFDDTKQPTVLHVRAGSMIVLQKPADTTFLSRQNSMSLLVALDSSSEATGLLFWDDGDTKNSHILGEYILVDFVASGSSFVVTGNFGRKAVMSSFYRALIQQVRIMGLPKPPKRIIIDGSYILSNKQYYWNYDTKMKDMTSRDRSNRLNDSKDPNDGKARDVLDLKHILIPLARRTEVQWYF